MALTALSPLAVLRQSKGVTLPFVAKAVGCDKGHLSRIERGLVRPRVEIQNRLVQFYGGAITRDEIANPEEYADVKRGRPVRSARPQVAQ